MEGKAGQRIDGTKLQETFHATQGSRVLFYEQPRTFWKFEGPEIIQAREEKWQLFGNVNCGFSLFFPWGPLCYLGRDETMAAGMQRQQTESASVATETALLGCRRDPTCQCLHIRVHCPTGQGAGPYLWAPPFQGLRKHVKALI